MEKLNDLKRWMKREEKVAVAFSGGVDSATLVAVAHEVLQDKMIVLTGQSASMPSEDRAFVACFCAKLGLMHKFITTCEFDDENFRSNPENRCYYCKKELFGKLADYSKKMGFNSLLDGTNLSDLNGHRPGYRAIKEISFVKTPYIELEITKDDIRNISNYLGLEIAGKPSSACLASRIPSGSRIEPTDLRRVDAAENVLRKIGFTQVRVRHHGDLARVQCVAAEFSLVFEKKESIIRELKNAGYKFVTLDLENYGR